MDESLTPRENWGQGLKAVRETRGMTTEDLAQLTRIGIFFIESLEAGKFEQLPGDVFVRGFVKTICSTLKEDPKPFLEEYRVLTHPQTWTKSPSSTPSVPAAKKKKPWPLGYKIFILLLILSLFSGGLLWWILSRAPAPSTESSLHMPIIQSSPEEVLPSTPSPDAPLLSESPGEPQGLVTIRVLKPVQIMHKADPSEPYTAKIYEPGEYPFSFSKRMDFYVYDLSLVEVLYEGRLLKNLPKTQRKLSFVHQPKSNFS